MREIDIYRMLSQMGISPVQFVNWQAEQEQSFRQNTDSIIGVSVTTFTNATQIAPLNNL